MCGTDPSRFLHFYIKTGSKLQAKHIAFTEGDFTLNLSQYVYVILGLDYKTVSDYNHENCYVSGNINFKI